VRAISSAGERFVHTEEVTGSIPVSPTVFSQVRGVLGVVAPLTRQHPLITVSRVPAPLPPKILLPPKLRTRRR
jgi:hypothetical protein